MAEKDVYGLGLRIAVGRFAEEEKRREALDTKASLVLGFSGVLVGLLFDVFSQPIGWFSSGPPAYISFVLLLLASVSIAASAFVSLLALTVREYQGGPGSKILVHAAESWPDSHIQEKLLQAYAHAYQANWVHNQHKARLLTVGFTTLTLSVLFSSFAFALFMFL